VVFGRGFRVGRDHRFQVELGAGRSLHLGRVDQAVPAHPHAVVRFRELGNEIAAAVVGDDDLGVLGRQVGGLGDYPYTGLGAAATRHCARDVAGTGAAGWFARASGDDRRDGRREHSEPDGMQFPHGFSPGVCALSSERREKYRPMTIFLPAQSSACSLTIEAPWLLPTQKVPGVVELSTKPRRTLVGRGNRYSTAAPVLVSMRTMRSLDIEPLHSSPLRSTNTS